MIIDLHIHIAHNDLILHRNDSNFKNQLDIIRKVYTIQVENIVKAYEMGVKIALGSDADAYAVGQVTGVFDEIKHFENIEFKKDIMLKMCVENGSKALKL